jgi:hypothetical protein
MAYPYTYTDYNDFEGPFEESNEGAAPWESAGGASFAPPPSRPPAKKKEEKKLTGATGATGPSQPQPQPQTALDRHPEFRNALAQHDQNVNSGNTWQERSAATANAAADQANGPPHVVGYHWTAGTGGVSGGNDAGMIVHYSDGSSQWVPTNKPGEFPPSVQTTQSAQDALLARANAGLRANALNPNSPVGGIIPSWNSPTGRNIDTSNPAQVGAATEAVKAFQGGASVEDIAKLSAASGTTTDLGGSNPPSGWLDRAIAASKAGQTTFNTGAAQGSGQYPVGQVSAGNPLESTYVSTPSGGTVGLGRAGQNDNPTPPATNPGVLYEAAARQNRQSSFNATASADQQNRENLYQAIQKAQQSKNDNNTY